MRLYKAKLDQLTINLEEFIGLMEETSVKDEFMVIFAFLTLLGASNKRKLDSKCKSQRTRIDSISQELGIAETYRQL